MRSWHAEWALVEGAIEPDCLLQADGDHFTAVVPRAPRPADAERLRGVSLPGFANAHSHAFHRALRGRTESGRGTFWTWREQMYRLAATLTPDRYRALARATFAEMALAGVTCVGEFHYLHHDVDGGPYGNPNEMGEALLQAAAEAGVRITLLDTCYLAGGFGRAVEGAQRRFSDGDAERWAARAGALRPGAHARIGAAIHSVRAVPAGQMAAVVGWARERGTPLHVHLSEQRAENEECERACGRSPARLLADVGVLGPGSTVVHATHLSGADVELLGATGTAVCVRRGPGSCRGGRSDGMGARPPRRIGSNGVSQGRLTMASAPEAYNTIEYSTDDRVALITLNRPHRMNAMNLELCSEVKRAVQAADEDPDVRVLVVTGRAAKPFPPATISARVKASAVSRRGPGGSIRTFSTPTVCGTAANPRLR